MKIFSENWKLRSRKITQQMSRVWSSKELIYLSFYLFNSVVYLGRNVPQYLWIWDEIMSEPVINLSNSCRRLIKTKPVTKYFLNLRVLNILHNSWTAEKTKMCSLRTLLKFPTYFAQVFLIGSYPSKHQSKDLKIIKLSSFQAM